MGKHWLKLAILLALCVGSGRNMAHAFAEDGQPSLTFDMDGDGRAETFSVSPPMGNMVTLTITRPGKRTIVARDIVISLEDANLTRVGNSLLLHSSWIGIGRNKWDAIITIAYRRGQYMVGGFTLSSWDSLDPDFGHSCDLNLFTGRGALNNGPNRRHNETARPITAWRGHMPLICLPPDH